MKKDQIKKEEGLPEIAQKHIKKNPIMLVVLGFILVVVGSMYFYTKSNKKTIQPVEENYTVQANHEVIGDKKVPTPVNTTAAMQTEQMKPELIQAQLALIQERRKELEQRLSAPLMIVNNREPDKVLDKTANTSVPSNDRNTQFMNQLSSQNQETETATTIAPLNSIIAEGSLIHAILESATNSDLPGYLRAIVAEPVYAEDGSQVLIPRGSRLIGQYKSGMLQGQTRIFIVWTRLIEPSGISIQLGSPGVDGLGVSGMNADEVDRHFWERFGTASLLSMIGAGAANAGVSGADQDNSASAYRTAVSNSFAQSAEQSLQQDNRIPPTLKTYQGKPIMVFVAKDLSFQSAIRQVKPKINVF